MMKKVKKINEEVFGGGLMGGGYTSTLSMPTFGPSTNVQGSPGYVHTILPATDTLQQKVNDVDPRSYIHAGSWVRGVGANNPDKHFSGIVSRIVKNSDGSVAFLYIKTFKTNTFVTIRADENLELISFKSDPKNTTYTICPTYNMDFQYNMK